MCAQLHGSLANGDIDSPLSLDAFREENDLSFGLLGDFQKEVIDEYGVRTEFAR